MATSMKPALVQTGKQTQSLFAEQLSSLECLHMSSTELQARVEFALEDNPLLEYSEAEDYLQENPSSTIEQEERVDDVDADIGIVEESLDYVFEHQASKASDDDWFSNIADEEPDFRDELLSELRCLSISDKTLSLASCLVSELNDHGLFDEPVAAIAQAYNSYISEEGFDVSITDWKEALQALRRVGPVGIGASSVAESLFLQIDDMKQDCSLTAHKELLRTLISSHLYEVSKKAYDSLHQELKVSVELLTEACNLIRSLNPYPIVNAAGGRPSYVTPELQIDLVGEKLSVRLSWQPLFSLRLASERKIAELRATIPSEQLSLYLKEAKQLVHDIDARNQTLLRVTKVLAEAQRDFFTSGENALKPILQKDIAQELSLSESTVSRALTGKYFICSRGTFALSDLIPHGATKAVEEYIAEFIRQESPLKPLSDDALVSKLEGVGFVVARRTVAKYRQMLGIPSTRERRLIATPDKS